jgi:hypothetical protein
VASYKKLCVAGRIVVFQSTFSSNFLYRAATPPRTVTATNAKASKGHGDPRQAADQIAVTQTPSLSEEHNAKAL